MENYLVRMTALSKGSWTLIYIHLRTRSPPVLYAAPSVEPREIVDVPIRMLQIEGLHFSETKFRSFSEMEPNPRVIEIRGSFVVWYILKAQQTTYEVLNSLGIKDDPLLEVTMELEHIALKDEYFIGKKLYPNIDFYSGITLKALGISTTMFTVVFALARSVGWIAQ